MKWNSAGAGSCTIFHVSLCVPGSFLHVAPGTAMPSESGLHASRAMELGVQIRPLIRPAHLSCVPSFRQSLMSSSLRAGIVASRRHRGPCPVNLGSMGAS